MATYDELNLVSPAVSESLSMVPRDDEDAFWARVDRQREPPCPACGCGVEMALDVPNEFPVNVYTVCRSCGDRRRVPRST